MTFINNKKYLCTTRNVYSACIDYFRYKLFENYFRMINECFTNWLALDLLWFP